MKLNQVFSFEDLPSAKTFSRAQTKLYEEQGMTIENFNGHGWIWYAVNLNKGEDQGILLQIFNESDIEGGILA